MEKEEINYLSVLNAETANDFIFNKEYIDEIVDIVTITLKKLNVSLNGKSLYYQRNSNRISLLAIKLTNGDDQDVSNYMFNGADARSFEHFKQCDVFLHADAKIGQLSIKIANMISKSIVAFFNKMETFYFENGMEDIDISFRLPLGEELNNNKEDTGIKKLIKQIFK